MSASEYQTELHFDIHASVVLQLGERLITDIAQALVELVKNCYDADATFAKVVVDTKAKPGELSSYQKAKGYISIEDDGIGMDEDTIREGWLTISNSPKREMKSIGLTTQRGRTPLGDKGLGRLCAQRLAHNVEIFTRPKRPPIEYHVAFSWNSFTDRNIKLTQIPVIFDRKSPPQRVVGTKLIISDLRDVDAWDDKAVSELEIKLSQLISPYKEVENFIVSAIVDGRRLELAEYSEQVKKAASVHYNLDFDGKELHVKGKIKLDFVRPDTDEEKQEFREFVEGDRGLEFFEYLSSKRQAERFHLKKTQGEDWYLELEYNKLLAVIDKVKTLADGKLANPGPFFGEIDYIKLTSDNSGSRSLGGTSTLRKFVRDLGGIRVFRDGFGIRVDSDWLGLGKQQTIARSFYGLRPGNTIGYIALSAKENAVLEEKTDREGFTASPYFDNFYFLLRDFVKFTLDAQTFVRRNWIDFRRDKIANSPKIQSSPPAEEITTKIDQTLLNAARNEAVLRETVGSLEKATVEAEQIVEFIGNVDLQRLGDKTAERASVEALTQSLTQRVEQARKEVTQVESYVHDVSGLHEEAGVLHDQIAVFRSQIALFSEQLSLTYETVSLGLTAEALSHELTIIVDQLAYRNRQTMDYLKNRNIKDLWFTSFTEYINTTVSAIRKQLSHLSPSLRYVRESKEQIILSDYFKEIEDFYKSRFESNNMELLFKQAEREKFTLFMNKGKLNQIIDNLLLNSEYWLREDMRLKRLARGIITIESSMPFVRVSDNGRGIEPSVEKSLFEPFVTTKGEGRGRGLGLFIVQQLLESENCSISLLPERNKFNHLYVFEINFIGGLSGSK